MTRLTGRLDREARTVEAMIRLCCQAHHGGTGDLCGECRDLAAYARERLARCPFGEQKPTCAKCPVHCYRPDRREAIRAVMRYAGPRMLMHHPLLAIEHLADGLRRRPER